MVIAKGNCYPDLALDTSRITDVRAAIVSDPAGECWGKYSCATSPEVVSEYKGGDSDVELVTEPDGDGIWKTFDEKQVYNANTVNGFLTQFAEVLEGLASKKYVDELIGGIENGSY